MSAMFTQGPAASDLTLFIGKEVEASGVLSLYLQAPFSVGNPDAGLEQTQAPLAISSTMHSNTYFTTTLAIDAPNIGSGIGEATLFVRVDEPSADGTVPVSGLMAMVVGGNNPAGVRQELSEETTLFIRVQETQTSGMTIYLERPLANSLPLNVINRTANGILPVSVSGTFNAAGLATLHIVPPQSKSLNTNIAGYLE